MFAGHEALQSKPSHPLRRSFIVASVDANRDDLRVLSAGDALEDVVDGDMGRCRQKHALAVIHGMENQFADGGGLPGARWSFEKEEVRRC